MRGYAILGGPSTGKTSVVRELARHGYETVPEAARMIIEREKARDAESPGCGILPWKRPYAFRALALSTSLELEAAARTDHAFIDSGLLENKVFWEFYHGRLPREFEFCVQRDRYKGVFMLAPLPGYTRDDIQYQNAAEAREIHGLIRDLYRENGYSLVDVPVLAVPERADFILAHLPSSALRRNNEKE